MAELSDAERQEWAVDPDIWPHTPPFHVFAALMDEDHNLWWRAGSGHGLNAYEAARQRIDELEAILREEFDRRLDDDDPEGPDTLTITARNIGDPSD